MRTTVFCGALVAMLGCGGGAAQSVETVDHGETAGLQQPWSEMSFEARRSYMASDVMPTMAALFQEHDAEQYADFGCDGCHGPTMQERNFEMPNPDILALHASGTPEQEQMVRDHPDMVRFMFQRVLPTMQELLGAEAFDDATGNGFSCYACHTRASEGAVPGADGATVAPTE